MLVLVSTMSLIGCVSTGGLSRSTVTRVDLSQNNYRLIRTGAMGQSKGLWLLGVIPLFSPSASEAKTDLYEHLDLGRQMEHKATALINVTEDWSVYYLILVAIPRITITADIIEFIDQPQSGGSHTGSGKADGNAQKPSTTPSAPHPPSSSKTPMTPEEENFESTPPASR
ncbi:MAG TPA: hypothetical protein VLY45_05290 [Nitrospiria bacterium]|nr:hypothetical protein [Nitrospiria bacterium]